MSFMKTVSVSAAALVISSGMAVASPTFSLAWMEDATAAQQAFNDFLPTSLRITENFDGAATLGGAPGGTTGTAATNRTATNAISTSVGLFEGLGGLGAGTTPVNDGSNIQVRSGNVGGRFNVLANPDALNQAEIGGAQTNFLDSNDTFGFTWTITNVWGSNFRGLQAFITDPNDVGGNLTVTMANGDIFSQNIRDLLALNENAPARQPGNPNRAIDGSIWHLTAMFEDDWDSLVFTFKKDNLNDGFAISNASISVIPLPAPVLMLLAGIGGLIGVRRFRSRAAA